MKRTYTLFIVIIVALLAVTPALAREHEPTGDRISLWDGDQSYPAGTPFYINHGFYVGRLSGPMNPPGQQFFKLEVDGVEVMPTFVDITNYVDPVEGYHFITRIFYFNFPEGMTGTHTFEGHWIIPCYFALEAGWVTECANPMADYDESYMYDVITFY